MGNITDVVKNLLIINVIIFVGTMALPDDIKNMGAIYFPLSENFRPYQIITHVFMHDGFTHLLFNMIGLFFLGPFVEQALGAKRFFILYFAAAFGATFLDVLIHFIGFYAFSINLADPSLVDSIIRNEVMQSQVTMDNIVTVKKMITILRTPALGASGAIYGILVAFAVMFPNMKLMLLFPPIPVKAKYLAIGLVIIGFISGLSFLDDGIGHWAHLGGALVGFVLVRYIWKMANLR